MSLNGMAESRRLWCHRRVWLKCSKTVARQSQVLPVRACPRLQQGSQDNPASPSAIARILYRGPGKARLLCSFALAPNRGRAGRQGSKRTHGPRRLATSRLVEVLCARLPLWFERKGKACRKSAKPKASRARCFRLAPHPPRWSFLPCEDETCCMTSHRNEAEGTLRQCSCDGSTVRLAAVTAPGVRIGTPEEARLGPPGPAPHLRCKVMLPATASRSASGDADRHPSATGRDIL